jgi:hypothetical protein
LWDYWVGVEDIGEKMVESLVTGLGSAEFNAEARRRGGAENGRGDKNVGQICGGLGGSSMVAAAAHRHAGNFGYAE